jgi:hypothetical protein
VAFCSSDYFPPCEKDLCKDEGMEAPATGSGERPSASEVQRWHPPGFTAVNRGYIAEPPPLERWETLLRTERSVAHQLVLIAARSPRLRRLLRLPEHLSEPAGSSVFDREQRVSDVEETALRRRLRRLTGGRHQKVSMPARVGQTRPRPGPLVDREIDAALTFLRNMPFEELQERGSQLHPNHIHWPLNDLRFLRANPELWLRKVVPECIEWDLDAQVELVGRIRGHAHELHDIAVDPAETPGEYVWAGGPFSGFDACAYYGLVRELQPKRVVEVGIGWSSLLLRRALDANGQPAEVTLIDPDPRPSRELMGELRPGWRVMESIVQTADLELFDTLEAGDIVFYDGSHCAFTASDLNWILFEVMPRLADGVWVHFHDIFWPDDYPPGWILDDGLTWNEQYFLQAFLMHNDAWRVRLSLSLLWSERHDVLAGWADPRWPFPGASGVWVERVVR